MKIFCTGSDGFIGKVFVNQALAAGHELQCVNKEWAHPLVPNAIPWGQFDAVVHLAAAGVKRDAGRNWLDCFEINFSALKLFLDQLAISGATPIVYLARTVLENEIAARPDLWGDPYVITKKLGWMFAQEWGKTYGGVLIGGLIPKCYGLGEVEAVAANILASISMTYESLRCRTIDSL